jgi:hypothetical protein
MIDGLSPIRTQLLGADATNARRKGRALSPPDESFAMVDCAIGTARSAT